MLFCEDDFYRSGAILSLNSSQVLIGWGKKVWQSSPDPDQPTFYFPDFFLQNKTPYLVMEKSAILPKDSLISKSYAKKNFSFESCGMERFMQSKESLKNYRLKKWVPYLYYRCNDTFCIQSALSSAIKTPHYLYGFWSEGEGWFGATPEILFSYQGTELQTMACAGTAKTEKDLLDSKIKKEHELVVLDIYEKLSPFGEVTLKKKKTVPFGSLFHLVTPISLKAAGLNFEAVVQALHPTCALGAYPKELGKKLLVEYDQHMPRGHFGAPAGVVLKDQAVAYVSIRGALFNHNGITIPIGCGIVEESDMEKEMEETEIKLKSTKEVLGL
jgi:menaquinone-specific isochorismate synthase